MKFSQKSFKKQFKPSINLCIKFIIYIYTYIICLNCHKLCMYKSNYVYDYQPGLFLKFINNSQMYKIIY